MNNRFEIAAATTALLVTLIGSTIAVENRYAKAEEVRQQLESLYAKQLKLRILEIQLKPSSQFTAADRALLEHMQQELREATSR